MPYFLVIVNRVFKATNIPKFASIMAARKRKKLPLYEDISVIDFAAEGKAISKVDGQVIFSKGTVPGDVVNLQVIKKKKNYLEARPTNFHHYSNDRIDPICEHFGICGGCSWQNLSYEKQLEYKHKQVEEQLKRIGKIENTEALPILGSERQTFYRNKLEFTFSNKKWLTDEEINSEQNFDRNALGFHKPGMFDKIVDINKCHLQGGLSNDIRSFIRTYALKHKLSFYDLREHDGLLRNLIIRTASTNELMVIISFGKNDEDDIKKLLQTVIAEFPAITSLLYVINEKKNDTITDLEIHPYAGNDHIIEEMEDLKFKIGPKSFFQTNAKQAYELYKITRDFAAITPNDLVYDLYTGTGTIANFVAKTAKKVIGLEYVPEAIEDAKINSALNNIDNTSFFAGDIKDLLSNEFIATNGKPDIVITDPPRAGMHANVIQQLLVVKPRRIVYVSCNPATQARDIELLSSSYHVTTIQPVDMFPHTHHVENVVSLELN